MSNGEPEIPRPEDSFRIGPRWEEYIGKAVGTVIREGGGGGRGEESIGLEGEFQAAKRSLHVCQNGTEI